MEEQMEKVCSFAQEITLEAINKQFGDTHVKTSNESVFDLKEYEKRMKLLGKFINLLRKIV